MKQTLTRPVPQATLPIIALVAARPHPVSGRPSRSRADATAAALALGLNAQTRLLSAGALPETVARDYLALGAAQIDILECDAGAYPALDALDALAAILLPALAGVPWVLAGSRGEAEQGSGLLPHLIAAALGRPVVADVLSVQPDGEAWTVTQALPKGARRRLRVLPPAVIVVSAAAPVMPRHSLAAALAGRIVRTQVHAPTAADAATAQPGDRFVPSNRRRQTLEAKAALTGHARMLGAIDSPSTGGTVLQAGDIDSQAQAVLDYLRTHSLVSF